MNKVLAAVLTAAALASQASADEIRMANGQNVPNAKVTRITADEIEYKVGEREVLYTAKKTDVARIVYEDGTEDVFAAPPPPPPPAPAVAAPPPPPEPAAAPAPAPKPIKESALDGWYGGIEGRIAYSNYNSGQGASSSAFFVQLGASHGHGFTIGGALRVLASNAVTFKPELNFSYRMPVVTNDPNNSVIIEDRAGEDKVVVNADVSYNYTEFAIGTQALFQCLLTADKNLFFESGVKLDIPFATKCNTVVKAGPEGISGAADFSQIRTDVDVGFVYGFGIMITDKITFNVRGATNFNDFMKIFSVHYTQLDVGLSILLSGLSL